MTLNEKAVNYVKKQNNNLSEYKIGPLHIIVKDQISNDIDLKHVFEHVNNLIPNHILQLVDMVYIGSFNIFKDKEVNAIFADDALYISEKQDDEEDLLDDIVHELVHAAEKRYGDLIYGDGNIEKEFLLKRSKLKKVLEHQNYDINQYNFYESEYDEEFDLFLYKEVGYDALRLMSVNLFVDPYAPTSLREYFASGFEQFYIGDKRFLKEISPYIYKKLVFLHEGEI